MLLVMGSDNSIVASLKLPKQHLYEFDIHEFCKVVNKRCEQKSLLVKKIFLNIFLKIDMYWSDEAEETTVPRISPDLFIHSIFSWTIFK